MERTATGNIDDQQTSEMSGRQDRLRTLAPIAVFDVAGPLAVYYGARAAGLSTVMALVVSGVLPALRVAGTVIQHRRLDVIGALVVSGIALGTVMGLLSGSARLYLLDGLVPTVAFGGACLVSLLSSRPLMFRVALETMGQDTPKRQAFAAMWEHPGFRKSFQVITIVWGMVFLAESGLQALIIETQSINTAKQTSNLVPVAVFVVTLAWTRGYGKRAEQRQRHTAGRADNITDQPRRFWLERHGRRQLASGSGRGAFGLTRPLCSTAVGDVPGDENTGYGVAHQLGDAQGGAGRGRLDDDDPSGGLGQEGYPPDCCGHLEGVAELPVPPPVGEVTALGGVRPDELQREAVHQRPRGPKRS